MTAVPEEIPEKPGSASTCPGVVRIAEYLGIGTNNYAEYSALLCALRFAVYYAAASELDVLADSELVVKQINGEYQVRNEGIRPLYDSATTLDCTPSQVFDPPRPPRKKQGSRQACQSRHGHAPQYREVGGTLAAADLGRYGRKGWPLVSRCASRRAVQSQSLQAHLSVRLRSRHRLRA